MNKPGQDTGVSSSGEFTLHTRGRCGTITYLENGRTVDIPWDLSGNPRYHLLLAPIDLRHWTRPSGEPISRDKQKEILTGLRRWFASQKTITDIDGPKLRNSEQRCAWRDCQHPALEGSAFCTEHFDETLLRG